MKSEMAYSLQLEIPESVSLNSKQLTRESKMGTEHVMPERKTDGRENEGTSGREEKKSREEEKAFEEKRNPDIKAKESQVDVNQKKKENPYKESKI